MTGEWWRRQQFHYINMKLSMERSDAAMSLSRRTDKSIFLFNWDKRKRKGNSRCSFTRTLRFTSFQHTQTWRIQSHPRQKKIQFCVMTSSGMDWAFLHKLISAKRAKLTSRAARLELSPMTRSRSHAVILLSGRWDIYLQFKDVARDSRWYCL